MLKVEKLSVYGLVEAVHGMRNPLNSWSKSDSRAVYNSDCDDPGWDFVVGEADFNLMKRLCDAGEEHRKWMRMVVIYADIIAPLYWWKEFDTYKVGTVTNSCSTMHTIHKREFTTLDFSDDHLLNGRHEKVLDPDGNDITMAPNELLGHIICHLNIYRELYLKTKDKTYWWQMIQLLPSSYNQKRTVMLNLEVCYKICKQREGHKLDEWKTLIDFLRSKVVLLDDCIA